MFTYSYTRRPVGPTWPKLIANARFGAPSRNKPLGKGQSMAQACAAAGMCQAQTKAYLAMQWARHCAGLPMHWPSASPAIARNNAVFAALA